MTDIEETISPPAEEEPDIVVEDDEDEELLVGATGTEIKLFGKWSFDDIEVRDISLVVGISNCTRTIHFVDESDALFAWNILFHCRIVHILQLILVHCRFFSCQSRITLPAKVIMLCICRTPPVGIKRNVSVKHRARL
jgi:hypothetical protein